jgi:hypothetical protein
MNAQTILLTHFSTRVDARVPSLACAHPEAFSTNVLDSSNVGIAFDFMHVTPQLLPWIPKLVPVAQRIFADENIVKE